MRRRSLFVGVVGIVIVLGWIGSIAQVRAQPPPLNVGFVRFAHTAIDIGPIDIYQGETSQLPIVTNLSYGEFTDFLTLNVTTTGFVARPAGSSPTGKPLFQLNWGVKSNKSDMIILAGLASNVEIILEPISILRNDMKDKARVRVVSMVWGTHLTIRTDKGLVLGQGLGPIGLSDQDVEPGKYNLEVVSAAGNVVYSMPEVELKANTAYTMLLAGGKDGTPPINVMNVVSDQEVTRVKIINKGTEAADIYIKHLGTLFAAGLASGAETGFVSMPSRDVTFVIRTPGSGPNSQEMAAIATQLLPGRDVTIVINANLTMEISEEVLTPLPDTLTSEGHTEVLPLQQQTR